MLGSFKDKQLYIELRPQCPKCRKEFMLDLKKFVPGRAHSCFACGTVVQFDSDLAERAQNLMEELERTIEDIYESFSPRKG
jgi:Fe2+ or Zn2+ uptake regulation protein